MHIAIDARLINQTGIGRYIRNLLTELAVIDTKNKYSLILQTRDIASVTLPADRFTKLPLDARWHTISEQIRMPRLLNSIRPDVVHIPYFNIPVFYKGVTVVTIHDLTYLTHATGRATTLPWPLYGAKRLAYRFVIGRGIASARKIIAVSKSTKKDILDNFSVPPGQIVVIYEGVDNRIRRTGTVSGKKPAGRPSPYVLYVGNAYPHKNLDVLVSGFFGYLKQSGRTDISLLLVGPDDYFYGKLKRQVAGHPLAGSVKFMGPAGDRELADLYAGSAVCVFPSLAEGFGLPPIEALSCGARVICSDIPVFHEILGDRVGYFNPRMGSDLTRVLSETFTSKRHVRPHTEFLSGFSFRRMAEATLRVYEAAAV